jgi:hypothetical protein
MPPHAPAQRLAPPRAICVVINVRCRHIQQHLWQACPMLHALALCMQGPADHSQEQRSSSRHGQQRLLQLATAGNAHGNPNTNDMVWYPIHTNACCWCPPRRLLLQCWHMDDTPCDVMHITASAGAASSAVTIMPTTSTHQSRTSWHQNLAPLVAITCMLPCQALSYIVIAHIPGDTLRRQHQLWHYSMPCTGDIMTCRPHVCCHVALPIHPRLAHHYHYHYCAVPEAGL